VVDQNAKAARAAAERAALELLRERASLVGTAATAMHLRNQLAEHLEHANAAYAEHYQRARDGGWTPQELAKLGLESPETDGATRRRRPTRATTHRHPEQAVTPPTATSS
jgi:hypothetical protein